MKSPSSAIKAISLDQLTVISNDKLQDIKTLENINNAIDDFLISSHNSSDYLAEIGIVTKMLKFKDNSSSYIRNKYGIFDRSRASKIREDGLEINHLEALEKISETPETLDKIDSWREDLGVLQKKITLIIEAEKEPVTKSYEEVLSEFSKLPKAETFRKDVGMIYVQRISEKALEILSNQSMTTLNFEDRQDRYYFANMLVKLGELSRELIDFANPGQESGMFTFLKKVRNNVIHNPIAMIDANESGIRDLYSLRRDLMTDFAMMVKNVVKHDGSFNIPKLPEAQKEQQKNMLKSISFKETKDSSSELSKKKQEIRNNLTRSIDEIEYLKWVTDHPKIDAAKKNDIMEFGVSKISHCLNTGTQSKDASLDKYVANAKSFKKSWLEMTKARNEKIAHGTMNHDESADYQTELANSVFAMSNDIKSLYNVFNYNALVTPERFNKAASDFLDRQYLVSMARNNMKIANHEDVKEILTKVMQFYDAETYPISISKSNPLIRQISLAAQTSLAAKYLLDNDYFARSLQVDLNEIAEFTQKIAKEFPETAALRQAYKTEKTLSKALDSLNPDEKGITYLLLAPEYFNVKRKALRLLIDVFYDDKDQFSALLKRVADMDEGIFGEVQKETLMMQGYLLDKQGKQEESGKKFSLAAQSTSGNKLNAVETLLHQSQFFGNKGDIVNARNCLKEAESIANSPPIDNPAKLMALSEIVVFESSQGEDLNKAMLYLEKLHAFFDQTKEEIRSDGGGGLISMEKVIMMAEVFALSQKYQPDPYPVLISENMPEKEVSILHKAFDRAMRVHEFIEDSDEYDVAQGRVGALAASLEAVAMSRDPSSSQNVALSTDLMQKASSLKQLYEFAQQYDSQGVDVKEMIEIIMGIAKIVDDLNEKGISKKFIKNVNDIYAKIINFDTICKDRSILSSYEWKSPVETFSDMLTNLADPRNSAEAFKYFSQSSAIKNLYHLPESRDALFALSHCQSRLAGKDESRHMQEAITRLEKVKLMPAQGGRIENIDIHNLLGDLYDIVGNFSEAIQNYRFVLNNAGSEAQKTNAQNSIANSLEGVRQEKVKMMKFKAVEAPLKTAYESTKADAPDVIMKRTPISKEDMSAYLKEVLKIESPQVNKVSKGLKIKLTPEVKTALDEKFLQDTQEKSSGSARR